jgi:hypothetical protein
MTKQTAPYSLRIPSRIMEWLQKSADRNQRSISNEINFKLSLAHTRSYSESELARFRKESPTKKNNEVFQFRIYPTLKDTLRMTAKLHGNSLNQEIIMHLFFLVEQDEDTDRATVIPFSIKENKQPSFEELAILKLLGKLNEKNKKAIINLIRDLSD